MMTAEDARRIRVNKGSINHETYKDIYGKIQNRIKASAAKGDTSVRYRIPPIVPGRPLYNIAHAVRYNRDKLRIAGFNVESIDDVLIIDWVVKPVVKKNAIPPKKPTPTPPQVKKPEKSTPTLLGTSAGISLKLAELKKKLKL